MAATTKRKPFVVWLLVTLSLLVAYPMSMRPVYWLAANGLFPYRALHIYDPIYYTMQALPEPFPSWYWEYQMNLSLSLPLDPTISPCGS